MAPGAHWHTASISCRGSVAPSFRRTCVAGAARSRGARSRGRRFGRPRGTRGPGTREPRARVERVPVVELLLHRVRRRVVVQVHEPREVVVADLGNEDAVREVARDVPLRSRERDLVDPRVQPLELRVVHGGHGRVSLRVPSAVAEANGGSANRSDDRAARRRDSVGGREWRCSRTTDPRAPRAPSASSGGGAPGGARRGRAAPITAAPP